ncbi:short-chain dehydrogenase [alpha proteobacterium AAP81b]|nr:short-chain dehydrogenase [alpha proteobacterium AAP81b]
MNPTSPGTAIVTGGAKRIGAALVRALAADGWHVVIHCNSSVADAEALAAELGRAAVVAADLADPAAAETIIAAACRFVAAGAPPLALLVNSASRFDYDAIEDFTAETFDRHMAINLRAPALLARAFAAALPAADAPALVVNLLDAKLASLNPDYFTYTLSKIGLGGLTELIARRYAPRLRCIGIAPAVTLVSGPQSRENFDAVHGMNPLGVGVTVGDIVAALRFAIATPTFNAQTLVLDGGQRLLGLPRDVAYMVTE